ncbi:MAG: caspase family protein [Lentisphaerae bacterium]|nr:caspase family protein [Lentisphaerota bacterium]
MRRAKILLGALIATVLMSAGADTVLCIGLNAYDRYPQLRYAENDATEMAQAFTRLGDDVQTLTGLDVTRAKVLEALARHPDLVYFAGHAVTGRLILRDGDLALTDIARAQTMLVLDCCYIGLGLKTSGTRKILAASTYEAFESGDHGLFTKYLLTWLNDGKGLSSEASLTSYLKMHIGAETGGWQRPVLGFI